MIFITGGKSQGKTTFAESFQRPIIDDIEMKIKEWMMNGNEEQEQLLRNIENEIDNEIREYEKNIEIIEGDKRRYNIAEHDEMTSVWKEEVVLISREIGCGIVPVDKQESMWREQSGRISCIIAKHATEVYKMESGIAVRIK